METKVEALEDNRTKVTVTVDAADIDARIKKTYKDFANKLQLPRVPQGQGPAPDHRQRPGRPKPCARRSPTTWSTAPILSPSTIATLYPIAKPEFDETDLVEAGRPYTFSFTVTVKPEIEISSYEPVEIELPPKARPTPRSTSRSTPCASTTTRSRTLPPPRR